jgi:hypothetical protein
VLAALAVRLYPCRRWPRRGASRQLRHRPHGLQPLPLWGLNLSLRHAEGTPAHASLLRLGAVRSVVALDAQGFADLFRSPLPEPVSRADPHVPGAGRDCRGPGSRVGRGALEGREALAALFDPASILRRR